MNKLVLGIDGGGTKTQCALFDICGNELDMINWGPTNHETLKDGYKSLKMELEKLIHFVLQKNHIRQEQIERSVVGMAGVDTKEQHGIISGIITEMGFKDFLLCNDAYLVIKAGSPDGCGIGVVNGTGCSVAGIDYTGRMLQVGGQGNMTGDLGGGVYLGEQVIRSVYDYFFRCGQYTLMLELLPEALKVESKYDFMDTVRRKIDDRTISASELNKIVFEAANAGDRVAVDILEVVGKELAASVNGILKELEFDIGRQIPVVLAGSINTKGNSPVLVDKIRRDILAVNAGKDIKLTVLDKPPVLGAVIWALEGLAEREDIVDRFFGRSSYA